MEEQWKTINGCENYEVSNEGGQVRNKKTGKILKQWKNNRGYLKVNLCKDGKPKQFSVHRLVAETWIPNPDNLPEVNHINENKEDNSVDNLEWCTRQYNVNYGTGKERAGETMKNKKIHCKRVYCYELDQTFNSIQEAEEATGAKHISQACRGKQKTAGKMHWKYVDES